VSSPALLAVAHGSRQPTARDTVAALARQVSRLAPVIDVRVAFLQHAKPSLADELSGTGRGAVIVPLLLSAGYHVTEDIAGAAGPAGAPIAAPLGPDPLLSTALAARLAESGAPAGTAVVLAAAGSTDQQATVDVRRQAELLADQLGVPVLAAFATAGEPTVEAAVTALHASTGSPVAIATYLLAPGDFHDRLRLASASWVSAPLGDHPAVAALILDRFRSARAAAGI
jgi:sirohydrochlorin ferrochelatase